MTLSKLAVVVLAAGQGTRMKSSLPKVLHRIAGRTLLDYVLDAVAGLMPERIVVVIAPDMPALADAVAARAGGRVRTAIQDRQLGTGHAVACAKAELTGYHGPDGSGDVLVVFGDTPLLTLETLQALCARRRAANAPDLLGLAFRPADPAQYGRFVLDGKGQVERIVEYNDASPAERAIGVCNAGVMLARGPVLFSLIERLGTDNAKGEYYLTDLFALAAAAGHRTGIAEANAEEVLGINSRAELAAAEAVMQRRLRAAALAGGATLVDPGSVWLSADTRLGRDVVVQPNVYFGPGVAVGDDAEIRAFCHLEGATIEAGAVIGPYARLRPGTVVGAGARIGNFVETKNAVLGPGAKANHLTYLGDAQVGAKANIGAGTITCNYDGFGKHRTYVGEGAFIGSNTALVAPVRIGKGAIVGAGSTITEDVAADALAVGRGPQTARAGAAKRFRARRDAAVAAKSKDSSGRTKTRKRRKDG
ncbi:MAG TPA: bifunctional UDP-N-acetylglucosamine diphosphorylase/glucosamine-1-phosphate N-acetyltransferase GlmU [Kiloniellales bacterium]